jgi:hypothetical protein
MICFGRCVPLPTQVGNIMLNDMVGKHVADAVNVPFDIVHQVRRDVQPVRGHGPSKSRKRPYHMT